MMRRIWISILLFCSGAVFAQKTTAPRDERERDYVRELEGRLQAASKAMTNENVSAAVFTEHGQCLHGLAILKRETLDRQAQLKMLVQAAGDFQKALALEPSSIEAAMGFASALSAEVNVSGDDVKTREKKREAASIEEKLLARQDLSPQQRRQIEYSYKYDTLLANLDAKLKQQEQALQNELERTRPQRLAKIKASLEKPLSEQSALALEKKRREFQQNANAEKPALKYANELMYAYYETFKSAYFDEAKSILDKILSVNPRSSGALALMSCYLRTADKGGSIQFLKKAVEANPDDSYACDLVFADLTQRNLFIKRYNKNPTKELRQEIERLNYIVPLAQQVATNNLIATKGLLAPDAISEFVISPQEISIPPQK